MPESLRRGNCQIEKNSTPAFHVIVLHSTRLPMRQSEACFLPMEQVKDTLRATVRITYDGKVHKTFRGPKAEERFANEVRVLRFLEKQGCPFVPRLIESYPE